MAFKGMRFCRECDNMLQPKEQKVENECRLIYDCRICGYFEKAKKEGVEGEQDHCVYRSSEQQQSA